MIIKATRVLTYIGNEDWILTTLKNNLVKGSLQIGPSAPGCKIVEESITYHHSELDPPQFIDVEAPDGESVPLESLMPQPTLYGIGIIQSGGSITYTYGPDPNLFNLLEQVPAYPNEYIFQVNQEGEAQAIMFYSQHNNSWLAKCK